MALYKLRKNSASGQHSALKVLRAHVANVIGKIRGQETDIQGKMSHLKEYIYILYSVLKGGVSSLTPSLSSL